MGAVSTAPIDFGPDVSVRLSERPAQTLLRQCAANRSAAAAAALFKKGGGGGDGGKPDEAGPLAYNISDGSGGVGDGGGNPGAASLVRHPLVLMPGIVTSKLHLWHSADGCLSASGVHHRRLLWGGGPTESLSNVLDAGCWLRHLVLDPLDEGSADPPGIRVRGGEGVGGILFFFFFFFFFIFFFFFHCNSRHFFFFWGPHISSHLLTSTVCTPLPIPSNSSTPWTISLGYTGCGAPWSRP
jgi:hypothetical protein